PGPNSSVCLDGTNTNGTVSSIPLPAPLKEDGWTSTVLANDALNVTVDPCTPPAGIAKSLVLCPPTGQTSPIRHVLYIVTENKTFDQYFGDINQTTAHPEPGSYNADPSHLLH